MLGVGIVARSRGGSALDGDPAGLRALLHRALDFAGLGSGALRPVPADADRRMQHDVLWQAVLRDRAAGLRPFLVVGTAGTVDTGAFDDLAALGGFARAEGL